MSSQILWFDIETVPREISHQELLVWISKHEKDKPDGVSSRDWFWERATLFPERSKIVCISMGYVTNDDQFRFDSIVGEETDILNKFSTILNSLSGRKLGGYNIKNYDIPFVAKRMVINHLAVPSMLDFRDKKPREIDVVDVMEMRKFGGSVSTSLHVLCLCLGISSPKEMMDGKDVKDVWTTNIGSVIEYCQADVFATYKCRSKINNPTKKESVGAYISSMKDEEKKLSIISGKNWTNFVGRHAFQHFHGKYDSPLDMPEWLQIKFCEYVESYKLRNEQSNQTTLSTSSSGSSHDNYQQSESGETTHTDHQELSPSLALPDDETKNPSGSHSENHGPIKSKSDDTISETLLNAQ